MTAGTNLVLSNVTASITELKKTPMGIVQAGEGLPIAILNRNKPVFYVVPSATYEAIMDVMDDIELLRIIEQRKGDPEVKVDINNL